MSLLKSMNRRNFLKISGTTVGGMMLSGSLPSAWGAASDRFPSKQMQVLCPMNPGGGTDQSLRVVAPTWEKVLKVDKPFNIIYAPGAGGLIATRKMVREPKPDGHMLNFLPMPYLAWMFELGKADFPLSDVANIGNYMTDIDVLLVKKDAKWDRIDQFINDARGAKEPLTVAVSGPFSATHAATVVLRELSGANLKAISFNGGSQSRNAVAGGHTHACMAPYWSALHVFELTKAIGIFYSHNPAPNLWKPVPANDVLDFKIPDLIEPYPVYIHSQVKAKYPKRYEKLVDTLRQTVESDDFKQRAKSLDLTPFVQYLTPEQGDKAMNDYIQMLRKFKPAMEKDHKEMI